MESEHYITADPQSSYSQMLRGAAPRPPVHSLLGSNIVAVDASQGTIRISYESRAEFRNPAGTIQGGMLCAMLDDLTASLVDATLEGGQAVATLNLNVSFLRPASAGLPIQGEGRIQRRGRDVCYVAGTLLQEGKEVACASAVCKIVTLGARAA